jgi:HSP20 family protein
MALPSLWRSGRERGELLPSRDIWEPFSSLRRDMERLFEDFSRDFGGGPPATGGMAMAPRVDVSESDTELKIEAELPGIDEKDVEVTLSDGRLTIKGEKKQEKEEKKKDYHLVERSYGSFVRSLALLSTAERKCLAVAEQRCIRWRDDKGPARGPCHLGISRAGVGRRRTWASADGACSGGADSSHRSSRGCGRDG